MTDGKKDKKNKEKEKPQNSSTEKEGKKENASRRTHSLQLDITPSTYLSWSFHSRPCPDLFSLAADFKTHEPRKIIGVRDTGSSLQFRLMWNPNLGEESSRIVSWHSNSELRKETPQLVCLSAKFHSGICTIASSKILISFFSSFYRQLLDFYEEHLTFEDRSK